MTNYFFFHHLRVYFFICIFFLFGCTNSYHDHFFREHPELSRTSTTISGEVFQSDGYIESLPNSRTYTNLVSAIDGAKKRIWIEIYTWTDAAKLMDPILRAHAR